MYTNDDEVTNVDSSCGAAEDFFCSSYSVFWATGFSLLTFQHFGGTISSDCTRPRSVSMFRSSGWMDGEENTISKPDVSPSEALESDLVSDLPFAIPTTLHHVFNVSHGAVAAAQIRNEIPQVRSSCAR